MIVNIITVASIVKNSDVSRILLYGYRTSPALRGTQHCIALLRCGWNVPAIHPFICRSVYPSILVFMCLSSYNCCSRMEDLCSQMELMQEQNIGRCFAKLLYNLSGKGQLTLKMNPLHIHTFARLEQNNIRNRR